MKTKIIITLLSIFSIFTLTSITTAQEPTPQLIPAIELAPSLEEQQLQLGKALLAEGKELEAIEALKSATIEGNNRAGWIIVYLYTTGGKEVIQNHKEAIKWLTILSNYNDPDAREVIGDIYYFGRGNVNQDFSLAFKWYHHYAQLERDPDILVRLASLYATGSGTRKNIIIANDLFKEANDNGYIGGYFGQAQIYMQTPFYTRVLIPPPYLR